MLGVTLSKRARARAIQLPAWNEALGLPRPWDQQLSLRAQQILAFESDLLEYPDIFDGSRVVEKLTEELAGAAWSEVSRIEEMGGAIAAVESGYIKKQLVASNAQRVDAIERGEQVVVGVNCHRESAESPLLKGGATFSNQILAPKNASASASSSGANNETIAALSALSISFGTLPHATSTSCPPRLMRPEQV